MLIIIRADQVYGVKSEHTYAKIILRCVHICTHLYTFVHTSVRGVSVAKYSKYIWFIGYFCSIYFTRYVCVRFLFGLHLRML